MSDNMRLATEFMGMIPCDQWTELYLGTAGGKTLQKNCNHDNCFSTTTTSTMYGTIGGPPDYNNLIQAFELLERTRKVLNAQVSLTLSSNWHIEVLIGSTSFEISDDDLATGIVKTCAILLDEYPNMFILANM